MRKKYTLVGSFILLVLICLGAFYYYANKPYFEVSRLIEQAETESKVEELFGPAYKIFEKGDKDRYLKGWSYEEREITDHAAVYFLQDRFPENWDMIVYVYYDQEGNIEDYYIGGS